MAYTGSGTSADPAVPSTITELYQILTDASNGNVNGTTTGPYYIRLDTDIDCADDPNYIGYATRLGFAGINWAHSIAKLYSDTGNKTIRGLTIKDTYFITGSGFNSDYTLIQNINFIDCFFKPTGTATLFYDGNSSPLSKFDNCNISISVYPYGTGANVRVPDITGSGHGFAFTNCSMYFKFNSKYSYPSGYGGTSTFFRPNNTGCVNSVVILDGLAIKAQTGWDYPLFHLGQTNSNCKYCSYIIKNPTFLNAQPYILLGGSYNYFAILDPSFDSSITLPMSINAFTTQGQMMIAAADSTVWGTYITKGGNSEGVSYWLTLDQMKNENDLLTIGFIP